ncbi:FUSC family protein [Commensalibacter oyaizuii]|uniref:FUSC family protein n=1 Tax=Commensalibacter oyaizuii TaxID=3043873 RepID=A0ABT6Q401_9PROT|nr:FUSC family protein [Commensalibacter sp. TBRC 16381]MDI2091845.1 FUSC family protein [Commensalibacter sp. TBRC 16381]
MIYSLKKQEIYSAVQQSLRLLLSIALSSLIAHLCKLHEPYWALITSVIVTQTRIVQTLQTSRDQIVGSLIGGAAGLIAIALQEYFMWPSLVVFTIVIIPMVALVSWRPSMRLGVVTLAVVFLFPSPGGPFERPFDRMFAIVVGVIASLIASYCILRPQARCSAFLHASAAFDKLHILLHSVLTSKIVWEEVEVMNDQLTSELRDLASEIAEARKEHPNYTLEHSDPTLVKVFPILRRLQSDSIFIARAMDEYHQKLPKETEEVLKTALDQIFGVFIKLCNEQANHKEPFFCSKTSIDFEEMVAPILTEVKNNCPPTIQFTIEAICHDLVRGHDVFMSSKQQRASS